MKTKMGLLFLVSVMWGVSAVAIPVISEVGTGAGGLDDWDATARDVGDPPYMTANPPMPSVADVHGSGVAGIQVTGGALTGIPQDDLLWETVDFAGVNWGNWNGGLNDDSDDIRQIIFKFFADADGDGIWNDKATDGPNQLSVYFVGNSGALWFNNLDLQPAQWGTYHVNLIYGDGWYDASGGGFGSSDFYADAATTVTEVGLRIFYQGTGGEHYGVGEFRLDNEYYIVPEPQSYALLTVAFLSLGVTFRQRLKSWVAVALTKA